MESSKLDVLNKIYASIFEKTKVFGVSTGLGTGIRHDWTSYLEKYPKCRIIADAPGEVYEWCQQELKDNWIWTSTAVDRYTDIYFMHEEDAIVFKLKFSQLTQ